MDPVVVVVLSLQGTVRPVLWGRTSVPVVVVAKAERTGQPATLERSSSVTPLSHQEFVFPPNPRIPRAALLTRWWSSKALARVTGLCPVVSAMLMSLPSVVAVAVARTSVVVVAAVVSAR